MATRFAVPADPVAKSVGAGAFAAHLPVQIRRF
jgi:hypothetical protein